MNEENLEKSWAHQKSMLRQYSNDSGATTHCPRKICNWKVLPCDGTFSDEYRTTPEERVDIAARNIVAGVDNLINPDTETRQDVRAEYIGIKTRSWNGNRMIQRLSETP